MKIKTMRADLEIPTSRFKIVKDADGEERKVVVTVKLRPGNHNYKGLSVKDPKSAAVLKMYRKHGAVTFNDLLPCDVELLAKMPTNATDKERGQALQNAFGLKRPPVRPASWAAPKEGAKPRKAKSSGHPIGPVEPAKSSGKSGK